MLHSCTQSRGKTIQRIEIENEMITLDELILLANRQGWGNELTIGTRGCNGLFKSNLRVHQMQLSPEGQRQI